ncbi:MAG: hypothetical protein ACK56I_29835, partial [bacterium]
ALRVSPLHAHGRSALRQAQLALPPHAVLELELHQRVDRGQAGDFDARAVEAAGLAPLDRRGRGAGVRRAHAPRSARGTREFEHQRAPATQAHLHLARRFAFLAADRRQGELARQARAAAQAHHVGAARRWQL